MQTPEDTPHHSGPPDTHGWWLIQVPTKKPYLAHYDEDNPPDIEKLWQSGFKCWRLDTLAEVSKLPTLLTSLLAKPTVFWELAQAFNRIQVAGPWVEHHTDHHDFWVRRDVDGKNIASLFWAVPNWEAESLGSHFTIDSGPEDVEEAKAEVDKRLGWAGYFLVDAA